MHLQLGWFERGKILHPSGRERSRCVVCTAGVISLSAISGGGLLPQFDISGKRGKINSTRFEFFSNLGQPGELQPMAAMHFSKPHSQRT
jgi:hypothetical protein